MKIHDLPDGDLFSRLLRFGRLARRIDARLIVVLIEVERRRLDLRMGCSSMFDFCRRKLGMSEGAAFRRLTAARMVRRFPRLLPCLEGGAIHLTNLALLRDHVTEENLDELVQLASGKTKREVQEIVACLSPRPDVPARLRKLPVRSPTAAVGERAASTEPSVVPLAAVAKLDIAPPALRSPHTPTPAQAPADRPAHRPTDRPASIEPLSEARYKLTLTADDALRQKLERARDLMRHRHPGGDLAAVVDAALDALLAKLEKERLATNARPKRAASALPAEPGAISRATRRAVFERDGQQCTFRDDRGNRCPATGFLELDHIQARAHGGSGEPDNLRVRCRAHNQLHAELIFGQQKVAHRIRMRQRRSMRGDDATGGD